MHSRQKNDAQAYVRYSSTMEDGSAESVDHAWLRLTAFVRSLARADARRDLKSTSEKDV